MFNSEMPGNMELNSILFDAVQNCLRKSMYCFCVRYLFYTVSLLFLILLSMNNLPCMIEKHPSAQQSWTATV